MPDISTLELCLKYFLHDFLLKGSTHYSMGTTSCPRSSEEDPEGIALRICAEWKGKESAPSKSWVPLKAYNPLLWQSCFAYSVCSLRLCSMLRVVWLRGKILERRQTKILCWWLWNITNMMGLTDELLTYFLRLGRFENQWENLTSTGPRLSWWKYMENNDLYLHF